MERIPNDLGMFMAGRLGQYIHTALVEQLRFQLRFAGDSTV